MNESIKNEPWLKKILWLDATLGGVTAVAGFLWSTTLATISGHTTAFVLNVAAINLLYVGLAFIVASREPTSIRLLRILIYANWFWAVISVLMVVAYVGSVSRLGAVFLLVQPLIVGGLAYLENSQVAPTKAV